MKRHLFLAATFILLGAPVDVRAQTDSANGEKGVRDALEVHRLGLMKHDAAALKQLWADDYVFINGAGKVATKEERLANLGSGSTAFDDIAWGDDIRVRIYGDTAVATSTVTIKGQYSGKASSGDYQSMTVWVKRGDAWQLVANQITPIVAAK